MGILKFLMRTLIILLVIFMLGGLMIPDEWSVSRSILIQAKPETIYPYVSDFKKIDLWMKDNADKDESLKYTYEGPATGAGSKQLWMSKKSGSGTFEITQANPKTGIDYDLYVNLGLSQSFLQGSIVFTPKADATEVTWTDKGNSKKHFVRRWMSLLMKPLIIKDLDKDLANLKKLVEKDTPVKDSD